MADVFTIAHELGHAGHFARANAAQSYSIRTSPCTLWRPPRR
jgi:oligoendopeptidase F